MIVQGLPKVLGKFNIQTTENMFWLYLPIKMAKSTIVKVPEQLKQFSPLLWASVFNRQVVDSKTYYNNYIYITAKHMLVHSGFWGNRGGAHADGFLTNDINWVWYDKNPTIFNSGEFNVTPDHTKSLEEFEEQWDYKNEVTYPEYSLLQIDSSMVHKVAPVTRYDMRTFVKISMSTEKYNLLGNSHNYELDYEWTMYDRNEIRNNPIYAELSNSDYVPADIA